MSKTFRSISSQVWATLRNAADEAIDNEVSIAEFAQRYPVSQRKLARQAYRHGLGLRKMMTDHTSAYLD